MTYIMKMSNHLTYDIKTMSRICLREMVRANRKMNKKKLKGFLRDIFLELQSNNNEYHNVVHTFEVFQTVSLLIQQTGKHFTHRERTVLQISALCHDFGHMGMSNNEWTMETVFRNISQRSIDSLSAYEPISYNEVMHVDRSLILLDKHKIIDFEEMNILNQLILSTDLKKHDHFFSRGNVHTKIDKMIMIIKLADLSHALRPFHVHLYWVLKNQSERSRGENRLDSNFIKWIAADTLNFIDLFVKPLVNEFERHFGTTRDNFLESNIAVWKKYMNNTK